uniref:F-box domain-containing protein n=1 Tax=Angiostrongylus cantonensis TaxID=6313 RepID=A0A0K0D1C4_ANGCA
MLSEFEDLETRQITIEHPRKTMSQKNSGILNENNISFFIFQITFLGRIFFCQRSEFQQCPISVLVRIFGILDCKSLLNCELTCKRWSSVFRENLQQLPKLQTNQIRILFDEAGIFIFPVDEKKCPARYDMPSLPDLERRLRHLTTQSLFIRGLIPTESVPVLRFLLSVTLRPKFSPDMHSFFDELTRG